MTWTPPPALPSPLPTSKPERHALRQRLAEHYLAELPPRLARLKAATRGRSDRCTAAEHSKCDAGVRGCLCEHHDGLASRAKPPPGGGGGFRGFFRIRPFGGDHGIHSPGVSVAQDSDRPTGPRAKSAPGGKVRGALCATAQAGPIRTATRRHVPPRSGESS
jgi:hypothetical protein